MIRSSGTPVTNSTWSSRPRRLIVSSLAPPGLRRPITTRWTSSRSVRSLAIASSRNLRPFMATSADAVVTRRPGTGCTSGAA